MNGVLSILASGSGVADEVGFSRDQDRDAAARVAAPPIITVRQFVAGPENRLALTAIERLLERGLLERGASYSPLVLYGPPGCGKTHLARDLAQQWPRRHKRARVVCLSAAELAEQYVEALEEHAIDGWRARLRGADLLVLEDLGQIAAKPLVQGELLHVLDALADREASVLVTSRLAPAEMTTLAPGLQSRLSGGLCAPLTAPGVLARQEILRQLAATRRLVIDERTMRKLAEALAVTAPELAGALAQLELFARAQPPATLGESAIRESAIRESVVERYLASRETPKQPSLQGIASHTARYFALKVAELKSPSRRRAVVVARDVAMYLARQMTGKSLKQIGEFFGGRDHTTVLHGCRKTEGLIQSDPGTQLAVLELRRGLAAG
ncbi:MAG TPA: DnaA/Hda family protein [Pirellulales bacterium]|nr:DnaA/Hda family protein [Pirellulales bacterium]